MNLFFIDPEAVVNYWEEKNNKMFKKSIRQRRKNHKFGFLVFDKQRRRVSPKKNKPIKVGSKLLHVHVCGGGMLEVGVGVEG